jgi:hypothetical protein
LSRWRSVFRQNPTVAGPAQDNFMRMLRERIAPALLAAGLKGSGREYLLPSTTHWIQLGFQGSTANTSTRVTFTVNCKVVRKDVWAAMYEERPHIGRAPKPNVHAGTFEWMQRIGQLMPPRRDTWWSLEHDQDPGGVADEVLDAILSFGLPAMRHEWVGAD